MNARDARFYVDTFIILEWLYTDVGSTSPFFEADATLFEIETINNREAGGL